VPIYEKVLDGTVVERVQPVAGDYSDTELGVLALEYSGGDGWRREGQVVEQPVTEDVEQPPAEPSTKDTTKTAARPRRGTDTEE
jgi:hypothetical protein